MPQPDRGRLGGRHIHQGPEGAVIDDSCDRLALTHVVAQLDRIKVTDLPGDRRRHILVAKRRRVSLDLIGTADRFGHVVVALTRRDGALLVQKDVTLGVDAIAAGQGFAGVEIGTLLHVVEHQDRLAGLHPLPLHGQDLDHPAIDLGAQGHIGGRFEPADHLNARHEGGVADLLYLNHQRRPALGLGGAGHQGEHRQQRNQVDGRMTHSQGAYGRKLPRIWPG